MKLSSALRIVSDLFCKRGLRENYWAACRTLNRLVNLLHTANRTFAYHVAVDLTRFVFDTVSPIEGQTRERARAAVEWIMRAQAATADAGVSVGYFPCDKANGWRASYPETTGYIIPTMLRFSTLYRDERVRERALQMAMWEVDIQMASGAVQGGPVCSREEQTPAVFNTGMVLDGWSAAYRLSGERQFLEAGGRAADYLLNDMGEDGNFRTHGRFVTPHETKTYNCLCAWALYRYGEDKKDDRYLQAAIRAVEAALRQEQPQGWFANNCLTRPDAPLLHTIGYTLQGILEVGILSGREDFIEAARRGTDPIISRISKAGFVQGRFYSDWRPALFSSCLTGSAQLAVVCYRLFNHLGVWTYREAADKVINYLKALQAIDSADPSINGAIAGSFPILGQYMSLGYPNWATKYFLDGLMLQDQLDSVSASTSHRRNVGRIRNVGHTRKTADKVTSSTFSSSPFRRLSR
jgi:hypothetical protein